MDRIVNGILLELPAVYGNCMKVMRVDICSAFGILPNVVRELFYEIHEGRSSRLTLQDTESAKGLSGSLMDQELQRRVILYWSL